jgi:hypothetical protein
MRWNCAVSEKVHNLEEERRFGLSQRRRVLLICQLFGAPATLVLVSLYVSLSPERLSRAPVWCLLLAAIGGALMGGFLEIARKEEWFRATFVVTSQRIVKLMPSGRRVKGRWSELIASSKSLETLQFSDGAHVYICRFYSFHHELLQAAAVASGPHSSLSMALQKARTQYAMAPRLRYIYGQLFVCCLLAASAVYFWVGDREGALCLLWSGLALSPALWAATFLGLRMRERKRKGASGRYADKLAE